MPVLSAILALAGAEALGCSIPVFRYALERWPAEPYLAVVFHKGALSAEQEKVVEALRKGANTEDAPANLEVHAVDVAEKMSKEAEAIWKQEGEAAELPRLVVLYPHSTGVPERAWAGPLNGANAAALLDSPARQALAKRLLAGDCAVWLLVESGDKAKDDAAAKLLAAELKKLEDVLELPRGMDFGFDDEPPPGAPDEPAPREENLKVAFSVVRVSRSDPAERVFLDTLLGVHEELKKERGVLAFAVFGQGRALPPLVGDGIEADNIADVCAFVVGPCSCQVKAMNPGWDLLIAADWSAVFEGREPVEPSPPELAGSVSAPLPKAAEGAPEAPVAAVPAAASGGGPLLRNLLLAVAAGIAVLAIASLVLLRRRT